jgi:hypothetical protein
MLDACGQMTAIIEISRSARRMNRLGGSYLSLIDRFVSSLGPAESAGLSLFVSFL